MNYRDYPESLTEIKSNNATSWTPRDVLIDVLRQLDGGEITPDGLIVVYRTPIKKGTVRTGFRNSTVDTHVALGMLEAAQRFILDD